MDLWKLDPVLTLEEASEVLSLDAEVVARILPVFGDDDDQSVLRDDVLEFLMRSEI